jgi:hypothetical protein
LKYLIFAGRKHHYLKLKPLKEHLEKDGHEVDWIITNNAINIDSTFQYMRKEGEEFVHAYKTQGKLAEIINLYRNTLAGVDRDIFSHIPPFWVAYSIKEASEMIVYFRQLVNGVDGVFILHANNFFTKVLAYVANRDFRIPVYAFQEGALRHRDQETLKKQSTAADYCDALFVWSAESKNHYVKAGINPNKIVVTGALHLAGRKLDLSLKKVYRIPESRRVVSYLLPFSPEYKGDISEDLTVLNEFCRSIGAYFIVRKHPMDSIDLSGFNEDTRDEPFDMFSISDIVLGQHSTALAEAAALGCRVAEYGKDILESSGEIPVVVRDNLALIHNIMNDDPTVEMKKWGNSVVGETDKEAVFGKITKVIQ